MKWIPLSMLEVSPDTARQGEAPEPVLQAAP
jgi:hypothetical protein